MIISASYKTDIPTFYGEWFMNRLRAGYCKTINPYNKRVIRVSLAPSDVDGFVFWTKNVGPFLPHLEEIRDRGYPFIVQYTINAYPRALECSVVNASKSVEHLHRIREKYGPRVGVWRYDTIVISSLTPADFHLDNFERLCRDLKGATDEAVISFVHLYKKTLRNMNEAAQASGFTWEDPDVEVKHRMVTQLVAIAHAYHMQLSVCAQREYLVEGATDARCIDAVRLGEIGGKQFSAPLRGGREECGCYASRDIGEYDTCPHGCVYCYAVRERELAQQRYKTHDRSSEFLFAPADLLDDEPQGDRKKQLQLFQE